MPEEQTRQNKEYKMAVEFDIFVKRFSELDNFLREKSGDLLMKHERRIVELNNAQLMAGKNIDSNIMQSGYSPNYARRRRKKGLQTSFVDLKFTGKYQDSRKGQKVKDGLNVVSGVDYEKYLRGNFPRHVGLDDKNSEEIASLLEKEVAVLIEKYLTK